jgi:hypothetical protein
VSYHREATRNCKDKRWPIPANAEPKTLTLKPLRKKQRHILFFSYHKMLRKAKRLRMQPRHIGDEELKTCKKNNKQINLPQRSPPSQKYVHVIPVCHGSSVFLHMF